MKRALAIWRGRVRDAIAARHLVRGQGPVRLRTAVKTRDGVRLMPGQHVQVISRVPAAGQLVARRVLVRTRSEPIATARVPPPVLDMPERHGRDRHRAVVALMLAIAVAVVVIAGV